MICQRRPLVFDEYTFTKFAGNEFILPQLAKAVTKEDFEIMPVKIVSSEDYHYGLRSDGKYLTARGLSDNRRVDLKFFSRDYTKSPSSGYADPFNIELGKIVRRVHATEESEYQSAIRTYCNGKTEGHPRRPVTLIFFCDVPEMADKPQVQILDSPTRFSRRTKEDGAFRVVLVNMRSSIVNPEIGDLTPLFDYMRTLNFEKVEREYKRHQIDDEMYTLLSDIDSIVQNIFDSDHEDRCFRTNYEKQFQSFRSGEEEALAAIQYLIDHGRQEEADKLIHAGKNQMHKMLEALKEERRKNGEKVKDPILPVPPDDDEF